MKEIFSLFLILFAVLLVVLTASAGVVSLMVAT